MLKDKKALLLFLILAFSQTQIKVIGWIGISELILLLIGPFMLFAHRDEMKRDGLTTFMVLTFLWIMGAVITDFYRETDLNSMLRGVASPISVFCMTPTLYFLLRDDLKRVRWAMVGYAVTVLLSTYVLPAGVSYGYAESKGITALEAAEEYKLAVAAVVGSILALVPIFWYLRVPLFAICFVFGHAIFSLSQGSRGSFMIKLITAGMLILPFGKIKRLKTVHRAFPLLALASVLLVFLAKVGYEYAATSGWMGEAELQKYEIQSESKIGLLSGRPDFVGSFFVIKNSPILGHGSWARDVQGFRLRAAEFMEDDEYIDNYCRNPVLPLIPGHSHIFGFYAWHGVLGGLFWVYALYLLYRVMRYRLGIVPEIYAYLVLTLPATAWAILFSPFGARVPTTLFLVVCVLLSNYKTGMGVQNNLIKKGSY